MSRILSGIFSLWPHANSLDQLASAQSTSGRSCTHAPEEIYHLRIADESVGHFALCGSHSSINIVYSRSGAVARGPDARGAQARLGCQEAKVPFIFGHLQHGLLSVALACSGCLTLAELFFERSLFFLVGFGDAHAEPLAPAMSMRV